MAEINRVEFEWLIHYKCNYGCPYCFFAGKWEEVEKRNIYLPLEKWIEAWLRISKNYEYVRLLITGGEPFIYPSFIELLKVLSKHFSIGFDTNLSCSREELANFVENTVASNISLALSFHPMFSDFNSFLDKLLFLKRNGFNNICVQYVTYPEQLEQMKYFKDKFIENDVYFIPLPFRGRYQGRDYPRAHTEEEKRIIYDSMIDLNAEYQDRVNKHLNQVYSKNRLCSAGQLYARVDNDGSIYRCGQYITHPLNGAMGNIFDKDFRLLRVPLPCQQEVCPCDFRWLLK